MLDLLKKIVRSLAARILAGLVIGWLAFAWLGFEPLLKWAAPKYVAEHSQRILSIAHARFDPFRLAIDIDGIALSEPDGAPLLSLGHLRADFEASSLFRRAYTFRELRFDDPVLRLDLRADGSINWLEFVDAFSTADAPPPEAGRAPPRLIIEHLLLGNGAVDFSDRHFADDFHTRFDSLALELRDISTLPEMTGEHSLQLTTDFGARLRWKGVLGLNPLVATGDLALDSLALARIWPYLEVRLNMAPPEGEAALHFAYRLGYANGRLSVALEQLGLRIDTLALRGGDSAGSSIRLDSIRLDGGQFDLERRHAGFASLDVQGGRLALVRDAGGKLDMADWFAAKPGKSAAAPPADARVPDETPRPWTFAIDTVGLDRLALHVDDHSFSSPLLAEVGNLKIDFSLSGSSGMPTSGLLIDRFGLALADIRVSSAALDTPLLSLPLATLESGRFDLAARSITAARIMLRDGRIDARRAADGSLPILQALRPLAGAPADSPSAAGTARSDGSAWHYRLDALEASGFSLGLRDEAVTPAAAVELREIRIALAGVSDDLSQLLAVQAGLTLREGGRLEASGKIAPAPTAGELRIKLDDLALAPAQTYLSRIARLRIADGRFSSQGELRLRDGGWRYQGGAALRGLRLDDAASGERLLAWQALTSERLVLGPDQLETPEFRIDGLDAKFVIARDKQVNVAEVFRPAGSAGATSAPAAAASVAHRQARPAFGVKVDRLRIVKGAVDFADLSLALPFGARIHDLGGQLVGISNQPGLATRIELDGQVDEYGLASASGRINLFEPAALTAAQVRFKNVEMARLTPYSATFAGRRIASGKLSLDLQYKIDAGKLEGDNQILMEQLTLGEAVESPQAANLPLDLAIAILRDSDGRIDLGLPVSGRLDDPEFSYGAIVWKAFLNVITKIATAPFRALGALLGGGGDEKFSQVRFEPGAVKPIGPEREKLAQLASALARRPGLALGIHGASNAPLDTRALQEDAIGRALAAQAGRALAPDAEPGPPAFDDPALQSALEALFVKQFGAPALEAIRKSLVSTQAQADKAGDKATGKVDPAALAAALYDRARDAQPVEPARLATLAAGRAEAIRAELIARGIAPERVTIAEVATGDAALAQGDAVIATLSLEARRDDLSTTPVAPTQPAESAGPAR